MLIQSVPVRARGDFWNGKSEQNNHLLTRGNWTVDPKKLYTYRNVPHG